MFPSTDPAGQQVSPVTRVQVWFAEQPLLTKFTLVLCLGIYAIQVLVGYDNFGLVCLAARAVTANLQVYRLLTSPFVHGGLLHVAFNMLAFVPIGTSLERIQGTLALTHLVSLLILVGGASYVSLATAASYIPWSIATKISYQCAIGFSGVVFGLIVVDNNLTGATQRSIFGLFYVPAPLYPWTLLVIWQVIMPGVSFLGHLCGVLVGQLYVWGLLSWLTPSSSMFQSMESSSWLHWMYSQPMYIANTGGATGGLPITRPPSFAIPDSEGRSLEDSLNINNPRRYLASSTKNPDTSSIGDSAVDWCTYVLPGRGFGSMVQQVKQWITERFQGGWSRVPTQDPYAPTALGDPLIPESSSSSSPPTGSQRTGDGPSPRTAAAAAAQARQARFEASQKPLAPS